MLAVNATFWSQAVIAEVYALHVLLLLLLLWTLQRAARLNPIARALLWPALILGLSLAHHAMTLLAIPAVLLYLFLIDRTWWRMSLRAWLPILASLLGPLLLYAHVPLRSGPEATPWYHQPLGDGTLSLYGGGNLTAFVDFITGRSISVGFHSPAVASANLAAAVNLWRQHFGILGLLLVVLGLYVLFERRRPFLWLTAGIALAQQLFNLFYAIGDIAVYYTPLYAIAAVWAGYGAAGLCDGMLFRNALPTQSANAGATNASAAGWGSAGALIALVLFLLPIRAYLENTPAVDQSGNLAARAFWQPILAALPPGEAILVTNDRDEIPPLFYLQSVEHERAARHRPPSAHRAGRPLRRPRRHPRHCLVPSQRHARVSRQTHARPRNQIRPRTNPVAPHRVQAAIPAEPTYAVNHPLGNLTLLGYDWQPNDDAGRIEIRLHWRVDQRPAADYTTSVQLFEAAGARIAQSDGPPGGIYYPTSLWKPGERLVESHTLTLDATPDGETILQVGQYRSDDLSQPAPPLRMQTPSLAVAEPAPVAE